MDDQLGVITALIAVLSGLLPLILSSYYPFKKSPFQIVFVKDNDINKILIRNAGPNLVFIDKIELHKCPGHSKHGIRNISQKFGIVKNTKLLPGSSISALYSEDEIKGIVLDNYAFCYNKEYDDTEECRLGYKVIIESSEGKVGTKWFKMGLNTGIWCFYDYQWKRGSYYPTGKYYDRLAFERFRVYIMLFSVLMVASASLYGSTTWMWISLGLPLFCLLIGFLGATDGYCTVIGCVIDSLIWSIPILVWIYYMTSYVEITIFFGIIVILYVEVAFRKLSGWDM